MQLFFHQIKLMQGSFIANLYVSLLKTLKAGCSVFQCRL